jgi:hypothetical protein
MFLLAIPRLFFPKEKDRYHFFLRPVLFGDMLPTFFPGGMWRETVFGFPGLVCPPKGWLHAFMLTPLTCG